MPEKDTIDRMVESKVDQNQNERLAKLEAHYDNAIRELDSLKRGFYRYKVYQRETFDSFLKDDIKPMSKTQNIHSIALAIGGFIASTVATIYIMKLFGAQ